MTLISTVLSKMLIVIMIIIIIVMAAVFIHMSMPNFTMVGNFKKKKEKEYCNTSTVLCCHHPVVRHPVTVVIAVIDHIEKAVLLDVTSEKVSKGIFVLS